MRTSVLAILALLSGCSEPSGFVMPTPDSGVMPGGDAGPTPTGDTGPTPVVDGGTDAGVLPEDDAGTDAGRDAGAPPCSGIECPDAGTPTPDAGMPTGDAGPRDAGRDAGPPPDTTPVVQLALGDTHSCLLRSSGRVTCWGNPSFVGWPAAAVTDATEIAASGIYTYARRMDGSVVRWEGTGASLTVVPSMPPEAPMPPPEYAPGESFPLPTGDYVEIYRGAVHTCGRRMDGSVWCWGRNELSQIGRVTDPFLTDIHTVFPAGEVLLAGARMTATTIGVGRDHTCAALSDGRVMCWGSDSMLQLGRWVTGLESTEPVEPSWY